MNSPLESNQLLINALSRLYPEHQDLFPLIQSELSIKVFGYGDHIRRVSLVRNIRNRLVAKVKRSVKYRTRMQAKSIVTPQVSYEGYFNIKGVLDGLKDRNISAMTVPWINPSSSIYMLAERINKQISKAGIVPVLGSDVFSDIQELERQLHQYYANNNIKGLLLPYDLFLVQKLAIRAAKVNNVPSIVYLHGLPGIYSSIDNLRADYLAVWGQAIKREYVKLGADPAKILVVGHPQFSGKIPEQNVKYSFDNILVLTKALPGGNPVSDRTICRNREGCIAYPLLVMSVLKKLGVKKARLRPHPSESVSWYRTIVGDDFYTLDESPLDVSLSLSTLVIGPTTTMWLQARLANVHFQVFEPHLNGKFDLLGDIPVPPFDGNDSRLSVSKSCEELESMLCEKRVTDDSIYMDWVGEKYDNSLLLDLFQNRI